MKKPREKASVQQQIEEMIRLAKKNGLHDAATWAERRLAEALDIWNTNYARKPSP
jgi:hypothetical protein